MEKKENSLQQLKETIVKHIEKGIKDLSLLLDEDYQENGFIRDFQEVAGLFSTERSICCIDRRRAICNLYADFCDSYCFPFTSEGKRKDIFLKAINNHFC